MPLFVVNKGGSGVDIPDGVYTVTLVDIKGPKTVTAQRGPNAGQDIQLFDWTFAIDEGPLNGTEVDASTSTASGPRSKLYAFLTALFGGQSPQVGAGFEITDLAGRRALATIRTDDGGWPRLENLSALPPQMYQAPQAAPQPAQQQPQAPMTPTNTQAMVQPPAAAPRRRVAGTPVAVQEQIAQQAAAGQPPQAQDDLPF